MNKSLLTFGLLLALGLAPNATAGDLNIRPLEMLERYLISCRLHKCVQHNKPSARKCTGTEVLK